ncbi:GGDEF domain-containing protein [Paenibacillus nasutitermitis]|uniref:GGDEF domain-containing protein n=1 Tax=Paenibacillus nasutitermitis TaxID=1652958 RepID=A0A916YR20_9BACL|nr:GGDEF domain-containing protein [Paenibacillus nasutitermitis]GGD55964.1 hypothetical protein GCM10010911_12080 [Paenibacillus nasutitermitis]
MIILQWLAGPAGQTFASACVLTILVLTLFMSVRLYKSYRRNTTHRMLIVVLSIVILQQGALVSLAFPGLSHSPYLKLSYAITGYLAFIIINFVFMKLYTQPSTRLKGMPFLLLIIGLFAVAALQVALEPQMFNHSYGSELSLLALNFYGLVINFIILLNLQGIDRRFSYSASLIVYFMYQLSDLADSYVFHGSEPLLVILSQLLPVVYYGLLFLLLFDWVLERLFTTFQSSITDGLTSLYNRRHFNKKAAQLMGENIRIAIIFCDIDNFKMLNDTEGHHRADIVLKQVADIIREETAGIGLAGRYGGEELLGLVAAAGVKPENVAEVIRSRVEQESIVTVSIGVSCSRSGISAEEVVKLADEAMYRSKTTGKNKVTLHSSMKRSRNRSSEDGTKQNLRA